MTPSTKALHGLRWLRQGIALFQKQPARFAMLFLGYMFIMQLVSQIPVISLATFVTLPMFTMTFLYACRDMSAGKTISFDLLIAGFKRPVIKPLAILGLLYPVAGILALGCAALFDDGLLWRIFVGSGISMQELTQLQTSGNTNLLPALAVTLLIYLPATTVIWFATPLVAWQGMPIPKALFFSLMTVKRHLKAFIMFGLGCFVLCVVIPAVFSLLIMMFAELNIITVSISAVFSLWCMMVVYCAFWIIYDDLLNVSQA